MMALAPAHILNIKSIFVALIAALLTAPDVVLSRKHHLEVRVRGFLCRRRRLTGSHSNACDTFYLQNDMRPYIALSTFGFYTNGHLDVQLNHLTIDDEKSTDVVSIK